MELKDEELEVQFYWTQQIPIYHVNILSNLCIQNQLLHNTEHQVEGLLSEIMTAPLYYYQVPNTQTVQNNSTGWHLFETSRTEQIDITVKSGK